MIMGRKIGDIFPEEYESSINHIGFSEGAEVLVDVEHIKLIGYLRDFELPENTIKAIRDRKNSTNESVRFTGRDIDGLEEKIITHIAGAQDNLIRSLIRNPETYTYNKPDWPVIYIGKERVIVCAPCAPYTQPSPGTLDSPF